jgi:site-specific DNA recombinase
MNLASIPEPRQRRRKGAVVAAAKRKAAVYLRVSTDEQVEDGSSLESQEARCRAMCVARGLEIAGIYADAGKSGGTLERPALAELRTAVQAGVVGVVVVYAVDRLSRSQRDTLTLLEEFEQAGAGLAAASQPFDTTTPAGRAMVGMLAVFAELQRAEIRERTRVALKRKAARGEAINRMPLGLVREGKGYARCPDTWAIVARVLHERAGGATCQSIADGLNADSVPTATALRGERRGIVTGPGIWHAASVAKLCRHPAIRRLAELEAA